MIDALALKEQTDLLSLTERLTQVKRVATTGGGEYAGPCPFCGGQDRFRVQPNHGGGGRWMCRNCTSGKWQDAIDFVMRRDNCDFKTACAALAGPGGDLPTTGERRQPTPQPAYSPPAEDWQTLAALAVTKCQDLLLTPQADPAVDYLLSRGLSDFTWTHFMLGFSPGARFGDLFIPRGVVIPCMTVDTIWYIKIALLPGDPVTCEKCKQPAQARRACPTCGTVKKYRGVKGNQTAAIFGAEHLAGELPALFCEGEFDAMTAWQELRDLAEVATLGAARNLPDLATWGAYLVPLREILTAYDNDQAGKAGAALLAALSNRVRTLTLPEGVKDISAYFCTGGDLRGWLLGELERKLSAHPALAHSQPGEAR